MWLEYTRAHTHTTDLDCSCRHWDAAVEWLSEIEIALVTSVVSFDRRNGGITCRVTEDLPQGELEIPTFITDKEYSELLTQSKKTSLCYWKFPNKRGGWNLEVKKRCIKNSNCDYSTRQGDKVVGYIWMRRWSCTWLIRNRYPEGQMQS